MATPTRSRATATGRARPATADEAAVLTVYADAERYLLETVGGEVDAVATDADRGRDTATRQAQGARRVRAAVERTVLNLDRGGAAAIERVVGAAAESGVDAAVAQLARITGPADRGEVDRRALDRLAASTIDLAQVAHRSILRTVPDAYREVISRTVSGVLVGAQTRREASQRAMWALTDRGLTSFTDAAGRRWRLSSYVEMATRTAAARAHTDALLDRLAADGHDLVIVGDAANECDRCTPWEGKILARSGPVGRVEVAHALTGDTLVVDVAGTVDDARRAGLLHPNCRHDLSLFTPGVTPPVRVVRDPDGYAAGQRQRGIERHLRAWKEREAAALTPDARRGAAAKVKHYNAAMRGHLAEHPFLRRKREREGIDAGNAPTPALRARLAGRGPLAPAARSGSRAPAQMSAAELDRRLRQAARNGDDPGELAAERARRDAALTARRRARIAARRRTP